MADLATLGVEVQVSDAVAALQRLVGSLEAAGQGAQNLGAKEQQLNQINRETATGFGSLGEKVQQFGRGLGVGTELLSLGAFVAFGIAVRKATDILVEHEDVQTQLAIRLKSTGDTIGYTADQVNALARSLQDKTGIDEDEIVKAGTMLATYNRIGHEVFPQALKAGLDLSKSGRDLGEVMHALGFALNDPINGMQRLRRSQIEFNDAQKEAIKDAELNGDHHKAQAIILAEVERRYGGAAEAARDTFGGALNALSNQIKDNIKELGEGGLSGSLKDVTDDFAKFVGHTGEGLKVIGYYTGQTLRAIADTVGYAYRALTIAEGIARGQFITDFAGFKGKIDDFYATIKKNDEEIQKAADRFYNPKQTTQKTGHEDTTPVIPQGVQDQIKTLEKQAQAQQNIINLIHAEGEEKARVLRLGEEDVALTEAGLKRGSAAANALIAAVDKLSAARRGAELSTMLQKEQDSIRTSILETQAIHATGQAYRDLTIQLAGTEAVRKANEKGILDTNGALRSQAEAAERAKLAMQDAKADETLARQIQTVTKENEVLNLNAGLTREDVLARRQLQEQIDIQDALYNRHLSLMSEEGQKVAELTKQLDEQKFRQEDLRKSQQQTIDQEAQMRQAFEEAGNALSSSFIDAITNGKNLQGVFQGLEKDLEKIILQTLVFDRLQASFKQGLNAFFPSPGTPTGQGTGINAGTAYYGGMSDSLGRTKIVDPSEFIGARRFQSGGLASDEIPAVLHRGERVLNARETKKYDRGMGGGARISMTVVTPNADSFMQSSSQISHDLKRKMRSIR